MAKKNPKNAPPPVDDDEPTVEDVQAAAERMGLRVVEEEEALTETELKLRTLKAQASSSGGSLKVEKQAADKSWDIVGRFPIETFDEMTLPEEFGGGRYRAQALDEHGKFMKGSMLYWRFAEPRVKAKDSQASANPLESPLFALLMKTMQDSNANLARVMEASLSRQVAPPSIDPLKLVELLGAQRDKGNTTLDAALKLVDVIEKRADKAGGDDGGGILGELVTALTTAAKARQVGPRPALPAPGAPGAPRPQVAPRPNPQNPQEEPMPFVVTGTPLVDAMLKKQVERVVNAALEGDDPEDWASIIGDKVPDAYVGKVQEFVRSENFLKTCAAACPPAVSVGDWLKSFAAKLDSYLSEEPDPAEVVE